jgi:para-nitrobenzyl esterase
MRLLLIVFAALITACASLSLPPGQVNTTQGVGEGVSADGITSFLGIQYARAGRWELPGDGPDWDGVRKLDSFGPACPQERQTSLVEDCLFLNVFTPEGATPGAQLPVVVWFHGGGFRVGQGGSGPKLFAREGVIVVTFNYRLGVLGFRDWPGWSEADPRNFGQADMVKALAWVNANIENFGGDKNNVTIAGHSAGGMAVQLMMVDPRARGLFQRAISDAGYGTWPLPQAANPTPEQRTRMRYAGLETDAPAAELVQQTPFFHLPYIGGSDLPRQPIELFESGAQARVGYMAGANSYDGYRTLEGAGYSAESFLADYRSNAALGQAYAGDFAVSEQQAATRIFGDMRYVYAAWATVRAMTTVKRPGYLFYFTQPTPELPGAAHGAHLRQVFGADAAPLKRYLINFIKTGDPNSPDLPRWAPCNDTMENWMVLDPDPKPGPDPITLKMRLLSELTFPEPGSSRD